MSETDIKNKELIVYQLSGRVEHCIASDSCLSPEFLCSVLLPERFTDTSICGTPSALLMSLETLQR